MPQKLLHPIKEDIDKAKSEMLSLICGADRTVFLLDCDAIYHVCPVCYFFSEKKWRGLYAPLMKHKRFHSPALIVVHGIPSPDFQNHMEFNALPIATFDFDIWEGKHATSYTATEGKQAMILKYGKYLL